MKSFLKKLNPLRLVKRVDKRLNEETEEKTRIAARTALLQLDEDLPILTALLSGESVTVSVTLKLESPE